MPTLFSLLLLCAATPALAQMDAKMSWPDLLQEPAIVRATVTDGGPWIATVRVDRVLKGDVVEGPLTVTGYNSPGFPPMAVDNETLREGETYWLFLRPFTGVQQAGEIPLGPDAFPENTWRVPHPLLGDLRVFDQGVRLQAVEPMYPVFGTLMPHDRFERFLDLALAKAVGDQPSQQDLRPFYDCVKQPEQPPGGPQAQESPQAQCVALLAHLGATVWNDDLQRLSASPSEVTRGAVAMAAANMAGEGPQGAVVRALVDPSDVTHGLATKAAKGSAYRAEVATTLGQVLAKVREPVLPAGVAPPHVRSDEGRRKLARALVQLDEKSAIPVIVAELPFCNAELLPAFVEALDLLGSDAYTPVLLKLLGQRDNRFLALLEVLRHMEVYDARPILHELLADETLNEERVRKVLWTLEVLGDQESARRVRARLSGRLESPQRWSDARRDMAAAELETLRALTGPEASDLAYELARSYLGVPRQAADAEWLATYSQELDAKRASVLKVLGPDSEATLIWVAQRPSAIGTGEAGVRIYVDAKAGALRPGLRDELAVAAGTSSSQVRVCGPGRRGWACRDGEQPPWRIHQIMANAIADVIILKAGYGEAGLMLPDTEAIAWLQALQASGIMQRAGGAWKLTDLDRPLVPEWFLPVPQPLFRRTANP